jgi:Mrp family chromosome partitioning ATPase
VFVARAHSSRYVDVTTLQDRIRAAGARAIGVILNQP